MSGVWPPKKLTRDVHNAMYTVFNYLSQRYTMPLTLIVKTGTSEREYYNEKTVKELKRRSKQAASGWRIMGMYEALDILLENEHLEPRLSCGNSQIDLDKLRHS